MRHLEIDRPAGRAHLERVTSGWSVDLDLGPQADAEAATYVLGAAADAVAAEGGGLLRLWVRAGDPITTAAGDALGLTMERELHQLRRPLPVDEPWDLAVRPFVVGQDEAAWLEVNNRAFAWHPEQGGWTIDDLQARIAEPWFDAAGFLLHEEAGRLLGFCWTKVHRDVEPNLGEIYVIATDPSAGGRGLGRSLTLAGLDHLHRAGLAVGMLYVDGTNEAGLRLYDKLGFTVDHTDRSYTIEVPAR
jgi:mycothiol synthase